MPNVEWFCQNLGNYSFVPYVLLAMPIGGAYLYGRKSTERNYKKIAWILIGAWAFIQLNLSFMTNTNCVG